jgi:hypothetical protein
MDQQIFINGTAGYGRIVSDGLDDPGWRGYAWFAEEDYEAVLASVAQHEGRAIARGRVDKRSEVYELAVTVKPLRSQSGKLGLQFRNVAGEYPRTLSD